MEAIMTAIAITYNMLRAMGFLVVIPAHGILNSILNVIG
jgi:hypothetical protein